jgi:hypothetical protein
LETPSFVVFKSDFSANTIIKVKGKVYFGMKITVFLGLDKPYVKAENRQDKF